MQGRRQAGSCGVRGPHQNFEKNNYFFLDIKYTEGRVFLLPVHTCAYFVIADIALSLHHLCINDPRALHLQVRSSLQVISNAFQALL